MTGDPDIKRNTHGGTKAPMIMVVSCSDRDLYIGELARASAELNMTVMVVDDNPNATTRGFAEPDLKAACTSFYDNLPRPEKPLKPVKKVQPWARQAGWAWKKRR